MSAPSPLLGVPPVDAGYDLLERLGDRGWNIVITPLETDAGSAGILITARRGDREHGVHCESVAAGALELFEAVRWY